MVFYPYNGCSFQLQLHIYITFQISFNYFSYFWPVHGICCRHAYKLLSLNLCVSLRGLIVIIGSLLLLIPRGAKQWLLVGGSWSERRWCAYFSSLLFWLYKLYPCYLTQTYEPFLHIIPCKHLVCVLVLFVLASWDKTLGFDLTNIKL